MLYEDKKAMLNYLVKDILCYVYNGFILLVWIVLMLWNVTDGEFLKLGNTRSSRMQDAFQYAHYINSADSHMQDT